MNDSHGGRKLITHCCRIYVTTNCNEARLYAVLLGHVGGVFL